MNTVTVIVVRPGWWLPGRALAVGETLMLDAATAEALARRGIVRLAPSPADLAAKKNVASNAGKAPSKRRVKEV